MGTTELQDQSKRLQGTQLLLVFVGLQLALFLSFLDSTSVSTAAPIIGQDLGASSSITWVGTSFLVANTSFQIVSSRLSDIFGRKSVLLGALFLFVVGDLLCTSVCFSSREQLFSVVDGSSGVLSHDSLANRDVYFRSRKAVSQRMPSGSTAAEQWQELEEAG